MNNYYERSLEQFLRPAPKSLARSAYACEVNPWTTKGDIEAALLFRGTIVSAYGFIETTLGEICLRVSRMPEYSQVRGSFPFSTKKRLIYLRQVFANGPLQPYAKTANKFFDKLEAVEDIRNIVAHAKMQVMAESGVTFHDFPESTTGGVIARHTPFTMPELERRAWKSALHSRLCQHLYNQLEKQRLLPSLTV